MYDEFSDPVSDEGVTWRRFSDAPDDLGVGLITENQHSLDASSQSEDGKRKPEEEPELKPGYEVNEQNMRVEDALIKLKIPLTNETKDLAMDSDKLKELQQKVENMSTAIDRLNYDMDTEKLHVKELEQERDLLSARVIDYESTEQTIRDKVKDLEEQLVLLKGLVYGGGETTTEKGDFLLQYELAITFFHHLT